MSINKIHRRNLFLKSIVIFMELLTCQLLIATLILLFRAVCGNGTYYRPQTKFGAK